MTEIVKVKDASLARPLKILAPLIKEEIRAGEDAGLEHYRAAGAMLLEAKSQLQHGAWQGWFRRQGFGWTLERAQVYMRAATTMAKNGGHQFSSLTEAIGKVAPARTAAPWVEPVREVVERVKTTALAREVEDKAAERRLLRELGFQLIDIGFKVLAAKLHPDKPGGSSEAMARLNKVRTILKGAL